MASKSPETAKAVARVVADAFGGTREAARYADDDGKEQIILISCADAPSVGYTSYSTADLHLADHRMDGRRIPIELSGVCSSSVGQFANVIATAAFFVRKNGLLAAPGVVFPNILGDYDLGTKMEHVMWNIPIEWPQLQTVSIAPDLEVHWLVAVPIYESERRFLLEHGVDEFEELLEASDAAYFDLSRPRVA